MTKNAFISYYKVFLFSRYLGFCVNFLFMQKKRLDQKNKVDLKTYDVKAWLTNSYNTHIAQYLQNITRDIFLQKLCRNEAGSLVPDLFLFLHKLYMRCKSKWSTAQFQCFSISLNFAYKKKKKTSRSIKLLTIDPEICSMLNFDFLEKGLRIVSPPHFNDFSRKMFLLFTAANNYFSSSGHHEQKNKKANVQIKFSAVTIKQQIKLVIFYFIYLRFGIHRTY